MSSIRGRLTTYIVTSIFLLIVVSGGTILIITQKKMVTMFDQTLLEKAKAFTSMTEYSPEEGVTFESIDEIMTEFSTGDDLEYYQLLTEAEVVQRSQSLARHHLPLIGSQLDSVEYQDIVLIDGRSGRLIETTFLAKIDTEDDESLLLSDIKVTLSLAKARDGLDTDLLFIKQTIILVALLSALIAFVFIFVFVNRGLKPLTNLAKQVENIDESNITSSALNIDPNQVIELQPIEKQIQHLTIRIGETITNLKQFSSDAAHELNTPIAELRALAEVGKESYDKGSQTWLFFQDAEDIAMQMSSIVTDLLELTRLDRKDVPVQKSSFLIAPLVDSVWSGILVVESSDETLVNAIPGELSIYSDVNKLRTILRNLLHNALIYKVSSERVRIYATTTSKYVSISVENLADGLDKVDITHMKERFWRKDTSRTGGKNSGLGLSLTESLCRVLELQLILTLKQNGTRFVATVKGLSLLASK